MLLKPWILPLVVCTVCGALVGTLLGLSGRSDDPDEAGESAVIVAAPVAYHQCPEVGPLGNLHGGDRVYATARDESSRWLEIRAPFALEARVWVEREAVDADRTFADLPVQPCRWEGPPADETFAEPPPPEPPPPEPEPPEPEPESSSIPPEPEPEPGSIPPEPEPEPEPAPGPVPPEPEPGPVPPEPEPEPIPAPDRNPPAIVAITADPGDIWELGCISPVSVIRTQVEDDEAVGDVLLSWSVGTESGSRLMHFEGGDFAAEIGNFASRTIDPAGSGEAPVVLTIDAIDTSGNMTTVTNSAVLVLHLCD